MPKWHKKYTHAHKNTNKTKNNSRVLVMLGNFSQAWGLCWIVVYIPKDILLEKTEQVWIANRFSIRSGSSCPLPWLSDGTFSDLNMCSPLHAALVFMRLYVYPHCCVWKMLLPWNYPLPLVLTVFLPLLAYRHLCFEWRSLMKIYYLGLRTLKPLILCILLSCG